MTTVRATATVSLDVEAVVRCEPGEPSVGFRGSRAVESFEIHAEDATEFCAACSHKVLGLAAADLDASAEKALDDATAERWETDV